MSVCKQLTREQRYQTCALKKVGMNQGVIAVELGFHKSTVLRELKRNRGQRGYRPKQAHDMAIARASHSPRISKETWGRVESKLEEQHRSRDEGGGMRAEG